MIPQGNALQKQQLVTASVQPSRTYRLHTASGHVAGMVEGLEALEQAVFKILQTPRYAHLIYTFNYGNEMNDIIGRHPLLVRSELNRLLQEALLQDDRITAVTDVAITLEEDAALISFTVVSKLGSLEMKQEVKKNV
ncbi:DUF2634 domain-containing protein [Paenibacillus sp. y28]|uniref:DUF2634 domain-containing protein n=1 Tax=Paenibacillus sp. y28 TaxID=3129110 RepID=UPI00301A208B